MKQLKLAALALLIVPAFTACTEEEESGRCPDIKVEATECVYVLNQGNQYDGIGGSLDRIDCVSNEYTGGFFKAVNGRELGDGPQDGLVYGSKMYIALYGSRLVWVCDANSGRIIKQIPVVDPEGICATDGKVYVSNNDGYVSCIDTVSLEVAANRLYVGPNPSGMAVAGGYVYVAVSDGWNSTHGYENGFKVAKIKPADFTLEKNITVGMNPTACVADAAGNVFVVCNGNYADVKSEVWKITPDDQAASFVPGSLITVRGTLLYSICSSYDATEPKTCKVYDTATGEVKNDALLPEDNFPPMPVSMKVDDKSGALYVTSDPSIFGYNSPGYVYVYRAACGAFVARYDAGVHPYAVFFK